MKQTLYHVLHVLTMGDGFPLAKESEIFKSRDEAFAYTKAEFTKKLDYLKNTQAKIKDYTQSESSYSPHIEYHQTDHSSLYSDTWFISSESIDLDSSSSSKPNSSDRGRVLFKFWELSKKGKLKNAINEAASKGLISEYNVSDYVSLVLFSDSKIRGAKDALNVLGDIDSSCWCIGYFEFESDGKTPTNNFLDHYCKDGWISQFDKPNTSNSEDLCL